jgi:hypothetical protein
VVWDAMNLAFHKTGIKHGKYTTDGHDFYTKMLKIMRSLDADEKLPEHCR